MEPVELKGQSQLFHGILFECVVQQEDKAALVWITVPVCVCVGGVHLFLNEWVFVQDQ